MTWQTVFVTGVAGFLGSHLAEALLEALTTIMEDADTVHHCATTAYAELSVFSPFLVTQNIGGPARAGASLDGGTS